MLVISSRLYMVDIARPVFNLPSGTDIYAGGQEDTGIFARLMMKATIAQ